jgi:hypothetical protein
MARYLPPVVHCSKLYQTPLIAHQLKVPPWEVRYSNTLELNNKIFIPLNSNPN